MNADRFKWCGYEWLTHPFWGDFHPNVKGFYWDPSQVNFDSDGSLLLTTSWKPKIVDNKGVWELREYACGLCRTIKEFTYGTFIAEIKLPEGMNLWPSFWLTAANTWPPEIDVMEGASGKDGKYRRNCFKYTVEPNFHYGNSDENHVNNGAKSVCKSLLRLNDFNEYKLVWTPDYIEIRYNNHTVYSVTDKKKLEWVNKDPWMHAKLNLNVTPDYTEADKKPEMVVKNFCYIHF